MAQTVQLGIERIGSWWCKLMHDAPMWPIHGQYECRNCGRYYPVPWSNRPNSSYATTPMALTRSATGGAGGLRMATKQIAADGAPMN